MLLFKDFKFIFKTKNGGYTKKSIVICALFISSLFPQVRPIVNDFLISGPDNKPSTFQQNLPQIYVTNSNNFVVSWTDYREGEAANFAQEYDKDGIKIRDNFNANANTGVYLKKNNYLLSLNTNYSTFFDDTYYEIISNLFNESNNNLVSKSIYNGISPWCGTGYIPGEGIVSASDNSFYFLSNYGGNLALTKIKDDKTINQFQLDNSQYITQITSAAGHDYFFAYIYGKKDDTVKTGLYTTFINSDDSVIVKDKFLTELSDSSGLWEYISNYTLRSISLNDSTYKLFWLNNTSLKLYSVSMNYKGEIVSNIDSIQISKPSLSDISLYDLILTNKQEDGFYLAAEWIDNSFVPVHTIDFTKYNLNGEKIGSMVERQDAGYFNNLFYTGQNIFFGAGSDNKDVFLEKFNLTDVVEKNKINDDQSGSNEVNAKPVLYNDNHFFAVWKDEEKSYGAILDENGNLAGDKIEIRGTDISFFKDNESVLTWVKEGDDSSFAGYTIYDDKFQEKFTKVIMQDYNYYNLHIQAKIISDSAFILLVDNYNELRIMKVGKEGNIISEKILDSKAGGIGNANIFPDYRDNSKTEIDSFWIGWNVKLQKFSKDLQALSELKNAPVYLPFYIGNDRFLTYTISVDSYPFSRTAYGTIVNSNFDTVKSNIPLAYFNINTNYWLFADRLDDNEFLVIHENGDNKYFARDYTTDGIARKDSFRVNSSSSSPIKSLSFAVNDDKVFFSWSQIKTAGKGYDIYGNIFNLIEITAVNEPRAVLPESFYLYQNYPNPFNPSTVIEYSLAEPAFVQITLYDILGRKIKELFSGEQYSGLHKINFDASGLESGLSSGVYLYTLNAVSRNGNFRSTKKMILLK